MTDGIKQFAEDEAQKYLENASVHREAAGNLAFLLSVIRCGEQLSENEVANVRRVIQRLRNEEPKAEFQQELQAAAIAFLNEAPMEGDYALLVLSMRTSVTAAGQQEMIAEYGRRRRRLLKAASKLQ
jgi:hypothetical protein